MKEILKRMVFTDIEKRILTDLVLVLFALISFALAWPVAIAITDTIVAFIAT